MTQPSPSPRVFCHSLPANLTDAVVRNTHAPLLDEGWFVASFVWGSSVAAVTFVFFGSVFFTGMPHHDPAAIRLVLVVSLFIGLISSIAGLNVNRRLRRHRQQKQSSPSPELHRAVAFHRRLAAALLVLLGIAGLWHAWLFSPLTRILGILAFVMALSLGLITLPTMLRLLTGQSQSFARAALTLERILLLGIGLLGVLIVAPPVARAEPGAFFLFLTQALSLLVLPWVAPLLAVAQIHSRVDP